MAFKEIGIAIAIAGLFSSCCKNIYYVNDPVVFANVKDKSDFNLAGGLNLGTKTGGLHFNGNVAISDNLFLSGSFTQYSGSCKSTTTINGNTTDNSKFYSGNSYLGSIGYYKGLGNEFYFEGSFGGKYGTNNNKKGEETFNFHHAKYFLQPAITYNRTHFQAGLGLRFGLIDFLPHSSTHQVISPNVADKGPLPFLDPSLFICGGGKHVKVGCQISSTIAEYASIAYSPFGILFSSAALDPLSLSVFLRVTFPDKDLK